MLIGRFSNTFNDRTDSFSIVLLPIPLTPLRIFTSGRRFHTMFFRPHKALISIRWMYSANFFASKNYCICVAWSKYPDKNFVKYEYPVLKGIEGKMAGPGHNSVVKMDENDYLCIYHTLTDQQNPSADRQVFFSKMKFENDKIVIEEPEI